jgi:predicted transcriptional regulator
MMHRTTLNLPDDLAKRYDELARAVGTSREEVMQTALEAYLGQLAEEKARLATAIAAADRGEVVDAEVVHADDTALLTRLGISPEQRAALHAEVEAEATAFYGVSCE